MKIEDYIKKNRRQLDTDKANSDQIWEGIRQGMQKSRKIHSPNFWKVAAILLILLSGSYIIKVETNLFDNKTPLAAYGKDLGNKEEHYREVIQVKLEEVNSLPTTNDEVITMLLNELQLLDTIYQMALNDLIISGYEEKIVNVVFDTYERRISLLEKIIKETKKNENYEKPYQQDI